MSPNVENALEQRSLPQCTSIGNGDVAASSVNEAFVLEALEQAAHHFTRRAEFGRNGFVGRSQHVAGRCQKMRG